MKKYLNLLNFELNRFMKLYIVLLLAIFVIQIIGTIVSANSYMMQANNAVFQGGVTQQEFIEMYSAFSMMDIVQSIWFMGSISIGVAALLFYLFFIWYRDWFARNTFIYRLLMLPTSRMNIFYTKATAIMLTVLGLVAFQHLFLHIEKMIVKWIVPKVYREDLGVIEAVQASEYLSIILPQRFPEFLIAYGLGFAFVVVVFTAILLERSYRLKGIIAGLLYGFISLLLFVSPFLIQIFIHGDIYLYPMEMFVVQAVMWAIIVAASLMISRFLLNHRVTV